MIKLREINFQAISKMSMSKRLKAFEGVKNGGLSYTMFSALTPTQFAELFPKSYRDQNPDIGGFLKAMPTSLTSAQQAARERQLAQTASGSAGGSDFDSRGYVKDYKENVQRVKSAHVGGGYVKPPPQLSPEQKLAFDSLVSGDNAVNSDIMKKTFGGLTDAQLADLGISKRKTNSGEVYHYEKTSLSDEQAVQRLKTSGGNGGSLAQNQGIAYQAAISEGLSPTAARAFVANISGEALKTPHIVNADPSRSNPNQIAHGIVQWEGKRAEAIREQFGKYPQDMSIQEQVKAAVWEMKTKYGPTWRTLNSNASAEEMVSVLVRDYERPQDTQGAINDRVRRLSGVNTVGQAETPQGLNGQYTPEQIQAAKNAFFKEENQARQQKLAAFLQSQGVDVGPVMKSGGTFTTANGFVVPKDSSLYSPGNAEECATLGKAFNPAIKHASEWKVSRNDAAIQPGVVVATQMYNQGPSRHGGGFHTGVALTAPNKDGDFLILNQSAGNRPSISHANVNNYNYGGSHPEIQGNYWGIISGHTERSREALQYAMTVGNAGQYRDQIQNSINEIDKTGAAAAVPDVKELQASGVQPDKVQHIEMKAGNLQPEGQANVSVDGKPGAQPTPGVGPSTMPNAPQAPGTERINMKAGDNVQPEGSAQVSVTKKETAAAPKGTSFTFSKENYLNEVARAHPEIDTLGALVGKDRNYAWRETLKGLKEAEANGVLTFDEKTGKMVINDMNHPQVQNILKEMKDNGLNKDAFLKQQEEKKKAEAEAKKEPPKITPTEPPKPATPAPAAPAPTHEGQGKTGASGVPNSGGGKGKDGEPGKSDAATAKPVPTASKGGDFNVGSQDLIAKPIGSLNGDNVIVGSKEGNPMFTMKASEDLTVKNGVASVRPKSKDSNIGPLPPVQPMIDMSASAPDNPGLKVKPSFGQPDQVSAQYSPNAIANEIAEASKPIARNETAYRAFARTNFVDTGSPIGGHYTYGDQNLK